MSKRKHVVERFTIADEVATWLNSLIGQTTHIALQDAELKELLVEHRQLRMAIETLTINKGVTLEMNTVREAVANEKLPSVLRNYLRQVLATFYANNRERYTSVPNLDSIEIPQPKITDLLHFQVLNVGADKVRVFALVEVDVP